MQQHKYALPPTTHTVEMTQLAELNDRLAARDPAETISAADLGLADVIVVSHGDGEGLGLPAEALIERVCYQGPPEFPYIHAHFRPDPAEIATLTVDLHTGALRELSHRLHLRDVWGVGSADDAGGATHR
jgi:hypothetical protein